MLIVDSAGQTEFATPDTTVWAQSCLGLGLWED